MPWGRIDDGYYRHRKISNLSEALVPMPLRLACVALEALAWSWSNAELADGVITLATVRVLGCGREAADELVRVGRWEVVSEGVWHIHDYDGYNRLRAQILAEREAEAKRQAEWRAAHPGRPRKRVSRRDTDRDAHRDTAAPDGSPNVDNPVDEVVSQRDTDHDAHGDTSPVSLARPESRIPVSPLPSPETSPPPPASQGHRSTGTNPRAAGTNPRATGDAPRARGQSERQERQAQKTGPTALADVMAEVARRAGAKTNGHAPSGQGSLFDEPGG